MKSEFSTVARDALIAALAEGKGVTAAAKAAGVHRTIVYEIAKSDARVRELLENRKGARKLKPKPDLTDLVGKDAADDIAKMSIAALRAIVADPSARHGDIVNATKTLLRYFPPTGSKPPEKLPATGLHDVATTSHDVQDDVDDDLEAELDALEDR